jgi:hypothetical protein
VRRHPHRRANAPQKVGSRCSEEKSVRAALTLCAQSQNGAPQGGRFRRHERHGPRADAVARASALKRRAPGRRSQAHNVAVRRPSRCPRARSDPSRRSNIAIPGNPPLRSKRLPARTGRRKTTSPPAAARLGTPRAARSHRTHRVCRLLADHRPTAGAVFRKAFRPASRRRGQSVLALLRERGIGCRTRCADLVSRRVLRLVPATAPAAERGPATRWRRRQTAWHGAGTRAPATLLVPARLGLRVGPCASTRRLSPRGSLTPAFPSAALHCAARPPANKTAGLPLLFVPFHSRKPPETGPDDARRLARCAYRVHVNREGPRPRCIEIRSVRRDGMKARRG